jgi:hypothetical protein
VKELTIVTDHLNLKYFTKKQKLSERQIRWAEILSRYNFKIEYRPGKLAITPDTLSRREQDMPADAEDDRLKGREIQLLQGTKRALRINRIGLLGPDQAATTVKAGFTSNADADGGGEEVPEGNEPPINPFEEDPLRSLWDTGLQNNARYYLIREAVRKGARQLPSAWGLSVMLSECSLDDDQRLCWRDRIWVPHHEPLRTRIIQTMHDSALSGHPGKDTLKALISRTFYWPGLSQDVRRFVKNCDVCGRINIWRDKKRGLLKPLPIPQRMWAEISLDFITDLPPTRIRNLTNLLVITDRLSKGVILEPMKEITSETTAAALITGLIRHHGLPRAIVSD